MQNKLFNKSKLKVCDFGRLVHVLVWNNDTYQYIYIIHTHSFIWHMWNNKQLIKFRMGTASNNNNENQKPTKYTWNKNKNKKKKQKQ